MLSQMGNLNQSGSDNDLRARYQSFEKIFENEQIKDMHKSEANITIFGHANTEESKR